MPAKNERFSSTVRSSYRPNCWLIYPVRSLTRHGDSTVSKPRILAWPDEGVSTVESIRRHVVLPEPSGPTIPKMPPGSTLNEAPARASTSSNLRARSSASTAGAVIPLAPPGGS